MRAILYARVSRGIKEERARSLLNQFEQCRQTAKRNGWIVLAEFAEDDNESSGASYNLPKLSEIMDLASLGRFDVLIVTELDRLSRRMAKQILIEQELSRAGVVIEYASRHFAETSEDQLDKYLRVSVAEYERAKVIERLERGVRKSIQSGNVFVSDRPPYGYYQTKKDGLRKLSILEDEALVVQIIFKWYVRGDLNLRHFGTPRIAKKLSQLRIPTATYNRSTFRENMNRRYGTWSTRSVYGYLSATVYVGQWQYGKGLSRKKRESSQIESSKLLCVSVPPIIKRETWEIAQAIRRNFRGKANNKYSYLFTGRISCMDCGRNLSLKFATSTSGFDRFHSFCRNAYGKTPSCKNHAYYQQKDLEAEVIDWICKQLGKRERKALIRQFKTEYLMLLEDDINDVKQLLELHKAQKRRLLALPTSTYLTDDNRDERLQNIEITLAALMQEVERLRSRIEIVESDWPSDIDTSDSSYLYVNEINVEYLVRSAFIGRFEVKAVAGLINGKKIVQITSNQGELALHLSRWFKREGKKMESISLDEV